MAVFRVERNTNYTTMSNYHLRDKNLSLKAKGLLSFCLSLPDTWDYSVAGLTKVCKEGRDCILSTLKELEEHGYLSRSRHRNEDGTLGAAEYVIYEFPHPSDDEPPQTDANEPESLQPTSENPTQEPSTLGASALENPPQIITNPIKTKRNNNEGNKRPRHRYGNYQNVLLTDEELFKLKTEFPSDYAQRIERLSEYMASTGKTYRNHLATIRSWARRDVKKPPVRYSHDNYLCEEGDSL